MKLISTPPTRPHEPTSSHLRETFASAPTPAEAVGTRGRPGGEQSPENVSTRREASAVCPRRRDRTDRRAQRGSATGHDIRRPRPVSTGAVRASREGKGNWRRPYTGSSGRRATKVLRALELSGDPKVYARDHGGRANNWGALAIGGASRLCVLRGRERGPAGRRSTRSSRASNSPSLAEDASANQFVCADSPATMTKAPRWMRTARGRFV
jgi:hypothetical protein